MKILKDDPTPIETEGAPGDVARLEGLVSGLAGAGIPDADDAVPLDSFCSPDEKI